MSVDKFAYDNKTGMIKVTLSDPEIHGNIDGGHTLKIILTKQKNNKLPAQQTGETVTRPGTSNPTALLVFLEGFRLFAERDKFFDLCFAFPGKEVHNCFRDCLIYHFREDGGVHADIQFFGDKDHRFKFRITLAGLQIYDRAGVHTEAFS